MSLSVLEGEKLLPVPAAVEKATGRRPHKSCCYRWMIGGSAGIQLPFVFLGGSRLTSVEAIHRWILAVTAARQGQPLQSRTTNQRERAIEKADRELAADGW